MNDIPDVLEKYALPKHNWIKTSAKEAGMGGTCDVPGQGCADKPYSSVTITDHTGQSKASGSVCTKMKNVDEACVNKTLEIGKSIGTWNLFNQCQSFAWSVVTKCRFGPQIE